jgi:hypothetical protein
MKKTKLPKTYKLTRTDTRNQNKAEVHKDSGLYGLKITVDKTIPNFKKAKEKVNLDFVRFFIKFKNVFKGTLNLAWKWVLKEHFPKPVDPADLTPENYCNLAINFCQAIQLFLQRMMHETKLRDHQLIYCQPGGDHQLCKDLGMSAIEHCHCYNELLYIAELLPVGDIAMPNEKLSLEWFYMNFHKSDCNQYVVGRRLINEMPESVTEYFKSLFNIKKNSGKLKLQLEQRNRKASEQGLVKG